MMQDGLHIGLAAWINQQASPGKFAAYPASPAQTALVDLEAIRNINDLAKAAEFARLVNVVPRQGQFADSFSDSAVLWRVHRDILNRMDHATEPWTRAEREQYRAARDVLYTSDASGLPVPSQQLLLYEEMKAAYQDLSDSGGTAAEIAQAMTNWLVLGNKSAIEDAFEVIRRLWVRSSRTQAENEALLLSADPPGIGLRFYGDLEFAPTYFAPISAISRDTWMEARVTFAELDRAVNSGSPNDKWTAYRGNRAGEVLFDYAVLHCIRPWFSASLYQADDWRLSQGDTVVSSGNGAEGLLPAYITAVYLVSVKNVTITSAPPRPRPFPLPRPRPGLLEDIHLVNAPEGIRGPVSKPIVRPKSLATAGPRMGVVKEVVNTPLLLRTAAPAVLQARPLQLDGGQTSVAIDARFTALPSGQVRRLTASDLNQRYSVAQAFLDRRAGTITAQPAAPEATPIHVAGFGCEKVPYSPNPNPNYRW